MPRELKALKAVYDPVVSNLRISHTRKCRIYEPRDSDIPKFISERIEVKVAETTMAWIGMFQAGGTLASQSDPGKPKTIKLSMDLTHL